MGGCSLRRTALRGTRCGRWPLPVLLIDHLVTERRRLELAALELYREQGFDRTTTAQIAKHAGVTERTFFHHF